jgi:hypothetical protein
VFLVLLTADSSGMMHITGLVGYHSKHGCYLYCGLPRCQAPQGKHYFPALLKPINYDVKGYTHRDIDIQYLLKPLREKYNMNLTFLVSSPNDSQYWVQHLATGISRPSLFSGLVSSLTLRLPQLASSDIMHLSVLNLSNLMISLWCSTMDCTRLDDKQS